MAAPPGNRQALVVVGVALTAAVAAGLVGWWIGGPLPEGTAPAAPPTQAAPSPDGAQAAADRIVVEGTTRALRAELEEGDDPEIRALRARLAADPEDVEALLDMGYLYVERRAYSKARGYYLRASQVAPANLEARTHLGTVAYFLGNVGEALHHYESALALDPDYTPALFEMGAVLRYGKGDLAGAVDAWEHFLALDPDAEEADRIRELVAEARGMMADGHPATAPAADTDAGPEPRPAPFDPDTAPWPGEGEGAG
jgi:tetratricopeptide (TPR) repeat protein